jgi:hypothetical protein
MEDERWATRPLDESRPLYHASSVYRHKFPSAFFVNNDVSRSQEFCKQLHFSLCTNTFRQSLKPVPRATFRLTRGDKRCIL